MRKSENTHGMMGLALAKRVGCSFFNSVQNVQKMNSLSTLSVFLIIVVFIKIHRFLDN
jgi:hypothetical protein